MKSFFILIACFFFGVVNGDSDTFSQDRLTSFYNTNLYEGKQDLYEANLGTSPPIGPAPISGYLPVVISNTTGQPDSQVYVILAGQSTVADSTQYYFQLGANGILTPVAASSTTFSANYSYPLSSLPSSATGPHDYLVYAPSLNGARFYFSIGSPMFLQSDTLTTATPPNQIVAPTYFAFYDPNYSNLYESIEVTFFPNGGSGGASSIPWTASVNTTEVDAFGLPIKISYYSYDSAFPSAVTPLVQDPNALPSGFGIGGLAGATTRSTILTNVVNGLTSGDATGDAVWPRLAIPFYTNPYTASGLQTYLRVLSPKQSLGNAANPVVQGGLTSFHLPAVQPGPTQFKNYNYPPFPSDYLSSTSYGDADSFLTDLFSYYLSSHPSPKSLYISTGGGNPTVYQGVATGTAPNLILTFTGISGPNTGTTCTLNQSTMNTFKMYSGSQLMSGTGADPSPDATNLGFYFGDAFTVGFLPSAIGTSASTPIDITDAVSWQPANIPNYYTPQYSSINGGPWLDLYAKQLHSVAVRNTASSDLNGVGLCYAYDFDDSLGISGTITPSNLTTASSNPYLGITLGAIDTNIPNPYSDQTAYTVVFNLLDPMTTSVQYQQGNGPWISVSNGQSVPGLVSNSTNPLRIQYTNGQGPTGTHEFIVYLYYQFLQPVNNYNSSELSIINTTTIVPNTVPPTQFTINLGP